MKTKVYRFEVWDHNKGESIVASSYSTLQRIEHVRGRALMESEIEVDQTMIDSDGKYIPDACE